MLRCSRPPLPRGIQAGDDRGPRGGALGVVVELREPQALVRQPVEVRRLRPRRRSSRCREKPMSSHMIRTMLGRGAESASRAYEAVTPARPNKRLGINRCKIDMVFLSIVVHVPTTIRAILVDRPLCPTLTTARKSQIRALCRRRCLMMRFAKKDVICLCWLEMVHKELYGPIYDLLPGRIDICAHASPVVPGILDDHDLNHGIRPSTTGIIDSSWQTNNRQELSPSDLGLLAFCIDPNTGMLEFAREFPAFRCRPLVSALRSPQRFVQFGIVVQRA